MADPRHVFVVSFDAANTVLRYFCSHDDIVIPGVSESNIYRGNLLHLSSKSQSLTPVRASSDVGKLSFTWADADKTVAGLINTQILAQRGLRGKRVQHWSGEKGDEWSSGYTLQQVQQFYKGIGWVNAGLQFSAEDVQRSELVEIFDPKKTTLTATLSLTTTTVNVNSSSGFELIQHGTSYSDAPSAEVGYIRVDDEFIRWTAKTATSFTIDNESSTLNGALAANASTVAVTDASTFRNSGSGYIDDLTAGVKYPITWTGKSGNNLTGVTGVTAAITTGENIYDMTGRGVLNTRPVEHKVDTDQPADKRKKCEELIYYELPKMKLAYAIFTGTLYGSADTIPSHHTLGISTDWIATSQFIGIGSDIWDPSDDTAGKPCRFVGLKKTNAKKFIEEQLNFPIGVYNPILNTGELGLKRMAAIMPDAAYSRLIKPADILKINRFFYDFDDIHNQFKVNWNHKEIIDDYTRSVLYIDQDSIDTWGEYKEFEVNARGLHGSKYTDNIIGTLINVWRNRHAGPPLKMSLTLDYSFRDLNVGQVVRVEIDEIPELTDENGNYQNLAISAEVQKVSINFISGQVDVDLFASTKKAGPIALGAGTALADSWYTSQGSDISGVGTVTGSTAGSVFTITANSSLTGATDLNSATATSDNDTGIFYWNGDLTINSGVTLTITENVELRVKGTFTNNGTINGKGNGLTGGASGQAGAIGSTKAGGGINMSNALFDYGYLSSVDSTVTEGSAHQAGPYLIDPGDDGTTLTGRPGDLRGSSGGKGGDIVVSGVNPGSTAGANGADGGAGLAVYCRGAIGGVSSSIDLSGDDGVTASIHNYSSGGMYLAAGSGAGGYPGGLAVFLDGDTVTNTLTDYFVANLGASEVQLTPLTEPAGYRQGGSHHSFYAGFQAESKAVSNLWVDYIPVPEAPTEDTLQQAPLPTAITVTEKPATENSINILGVEVSATAPADSDYDGTRISFKLSTDTAWRFVEDIYGNSEAVFWVPPDGSTYDIQAQSISITGEVSDDFIRRSYTASSSIEQILGAANAVKTSSTVGDGTANSYGVIVDGNGIRVYPANSSTPNINLNGATGEISANAGDVGGWNLTSTLLVSDNSRVEIDSGNQRIRVKNAGGTNYVDVDATGIHGYDSVLGYTFRLYTDGSAPIFSSGVIKEATYEVYTSGIIKTNSAPSTNGGVQLDSNGIKAYDTSGNLRTEIKSSTGEIILKSAINGQRIEINPSSDNEIHFYGDRGDATIEELSTIGISSSGGDNVIGLFGTSNSSRLALKAIANNAVAFKATANLAWAATFTSNSTASTSGVVSIWNGSTSTSSNALEVQSGYGYGITLPYSANQKAQLEIEPSSSASAPTHSARSGSIWMTSGAVPYLNVNGSTSWRKLPRIFESAQQTITSGGALTIAHGLNIKPSFVWVKLVCQTAEHNYSVNDELIIMGDTTNATTNNYGCAITVDSTNIYIRYGAVSSACFMGHNKTTGASTSLTNSNWKAVFVVIA